MKSARVALVFALALSAPAFAAPAVAPASEGGRGLAAAYRREIALLEAEKAALAAALDKTRSDAQARNVDERKRLASLEASLVAARAESDAQAARLASLEKAAASDDAALAPALASLQRALANVGVRAEMPTSADANGKLAATFSAALDDARRGATVRVVESGFFTADGHFVNGRIVELGHIGAVASATAAASKEAHEAPAGPIAFVPGSDVRQIDDASFTAAARSFVEGNGAAPIRFGAPAPSLTGVRDDAPTRWTLLGALALAAALLLGVGATARLLWLRRARRATTSSAKRAASYLAIGDITAAEAVCGSTVGPARDVLTSVFRAATVDVNAAVSSNDVAEDAVADSWLDGAASIDRMDRVLVAAIAGAGMLTLMATTHGARIAGFAALDVCIVAALPTLLLLVAARGESEKLKRELERSALLLVDVARKVRGA